ncbi:hypothetical protein [Hymenobacter sp. UV11]|uniref:hypothetical protein n=1 Tax=Hymenobacter sp. UV11 TaxID=1849735 RepID=UPI0014151ED1|nr:hypothetical protein [Hymenobacter sp. UV11]
MFDANNVSDQASPLAGWTWHLQEQSNGVYRASLTSEQGLQVETVGTDEAELLAWCVAAATTCEQELRLKLRQ